LVHADSGAAYAAPGHLLYARGSLLVAQPFDAGRGHVHGPAVPLIGGLSPTTWPTSRGVSPSQRGDLVVWRGHPRWQFAWYDRQGRELSRVGDPIEQLTSWDLSPDGSCVVGTVMAPGRNSLWHVDLSNGRRVRLTGEEDAADPRFSADGQTALFASTSRGIRRLHQVSLKGGARTSLGVPRVASDGSHPTHPWLNFHDWSRDGRIALYDPSETHRELWSVRLNESVPELVLRTEGLVDQARFSPDARWIAFNEFRSGRPDVFVVPFPPTGAKWQVSTHGGMQPAWRSDGRELFFLDPRGNLLAVDVHASATVQVGAPRLILSLGGLFGATEFEDYATTPDGQRFLVRVQADGSPSPTPTLILNWPALLRQ
jgi:Tol biopolymer transport system component